MSATGRPREGARRTKRDEDDAYLTPRAHALTCAALLDLRPRTDGRELRGLEPSAGEAAFVIALHDVHGVVVEAVDRRAEVAATLRACVPGKEVRVRTMRFEDVMEPDSFDVVAGNPPYFCALEHVKHALYLLRAGGVVGYLLRINFLATQGRYTFFRRFPPWRIYILAERPDFTGEGGDATEYAFIVWKKGWVGETVTRWISCEDEAYREEDLALVRRLDWDEAA